MPANPVPINIKQQGLLWLQPPYNWSDRQIAKKLDVSPSVVSRWRNELINDGLLCEDEWFLKNNEGWSPEQRFAVVLESAVMSEIELAEYCRHKGLFVEQVKEWRTISTQAHELKALNNHKVDKVVKEYRQKVRELEKELARKEKALAETAALLVNSEDA